MSRLSVFLKYQIGAARERLLIARHRWTGPNPPAGFRTILAKSMPRSGHHFLQTMLSRYFGQQLRYCEFYSQPGCCRCMPCLRRYDPLQGNLYFMQKSHDLFLWDNPRRDGLYLIQFRSLIPRVQSNFDLGVAGGFIADTWEAFEHFCIQQTEYSVKFYDKWIRKPAANRLVVSYETLSEAPLPTLARIVRFITGKEAIDDRKIVEVAASSNAKVNPAGVESGLRDPRKHRYFDEDLFRSLETIMLDRCGANAMRFHFIRP